MVKNARVLNGLKVNRRAEIALEECGVQRGGVGVRKADGTQPPEHQSAVSREYLGIVIAMLS
ncbi:hypothetical protein J6590_086764 [Homalodisca vitripennis]|nr:hypothetical protein J6590_086764 [Homalodisca vitripennis]